MILAMNMIFIIIIIILIIIITDPYLSHVYYDNNGDDVVVDDNDDDDHDDHDDAVYVDLVFILLDRPDESHDKLISEHIMNNRSSHQMNSRDDTIMGQPNIKSEDGNDVSKRMRRSINGIYGSCINDSMDGMGGMRGIRAGSIIHAVCMIFSLI
jgi:hypothetical protein